MSVFFKDESKECYQPMELAHLCSSSKCNLVLQQTSPWHIFLDTYIGDMDTVMASWFVSILETYFIYLFNLATKFTQQGCHQKSGGINQYTLLMGRHIPRFRSSLEQIKNVQPFYSKYWKFLLYHCSAVGFQILQARLIKCMYYLFRLWCLCHTSAMQ